MVFKLVIPNWQPATTNKLMRNRWTAARLKKADKNLVIGYCLHNRLPVATGPRRVDLLITRPSNQSGRVADPDAFWKSTLDALVHAKMLIDDSRRYCRPGEVVFAKGSQRETTISLTELEGE